MQRRQYEDQSASPSTSSSNSPQNQIDNQQIEEILTEFQGNSQQGKGVAIDSLAAVKLSSLLQQKLNVVIPPGYLISSQFVNKKNENGDKKDSFDLSKQISEITQIKSGERRENNVDVFEFVFLFHSLLSIYYCVNNDQRVINCRSLSIYYIILIIILFIYFILFFILFFSYLLIK